MKHFLLLTISALFIISCGSNSNKNAVQETDIVYAKAEIAIEGMTCTGCEQTVKAKLEALDGIKTTKASHTEKKAIIEYDRNSVDTAQIFEVIRGLDYVPLAMHPVTVDTLTH